MFESSSIQLKHHSIICEKQTKYENIDLTFESNNSINNSNNNKRIKKKLIIYDSNEINNDFVIEKRKYSEITQNNNNNNNDSMNKISKNLVSSNNSNVLNEQITNRMNFMNELPKILKCNLTSNIFKGLGLCNAYLPINITDNSQSQFIPNSFITQITIYFHKQTFQSIKINEINKSNQMIIIEINCKTMNLEIINKLIQINYNKLLNINNYYNYNNQLLNENISFYDYYIRNNVIIHICPIFSMF